MDGSTSLWRRLNERMALRALHEARGFSTHMPLHLYMQVASGCNLDCYMCPEHLRPPELKHGRDVQSLPRAIFDAVADEAFPHSSRLTIGVGGEPMISPDFLYFVRRAHELEQEVGLVTNGTRIRGDEVAETIARCVARLRVSIDGATRETYERIRIGSSWTKIRANLELLNRYRLKDPPETRQHLELCMVLMKSNLHELPQLVRLGHELQCDAVRGQHLIVMTDEGRSETILDEPERFNEVRELALERARELGIELDVPAPLPLAATQEPREPRAQPDEECARRAETHCAVPCASPTLELFILYDGRVFPCCHPYAHERMMVGDLRTQSFGEIWNGRLLRNLRTGLAAGDVPAICRTCSIVHDPPPAAEDPEVIRAEGDLAAYYGDRDLAPRGETPTFPRQLAESGLVDYIAELEEHAGNLEHLRGHLEGHIQNLEAERGPMQAHIDALERERAQRPRDGKLERLWRRARRVLSSRGRDDAS